jgi:hypothetical protein
MNPKSRGNKNKNTTINWDYIKLKSFCIAKETTQSKETIYTTVENICKPYI